MSALHADWQELTSPPQFEAMWLRMMGPDVPTPRLVEHGQLRALVGREPVAGSDDWRWHISVSRGDRIPRWGELVKVAHELRPSVVFVLGLPPRSWWINIHPHTLHLWETRDPHLVEQWRQEGRGDEPT